MVAVFGVIGTFITLAACMPPSERFPAKPEDLTTPFQQRIAFHGPHNVSIGWNTYQKLNESCIDYGTTNASLPSQACSNASVTYPTSRTWFNSVTLEGLKPNTKYYYKIGSTNSSIDHFMSSRQPGDNTTFAMGVVIDLGVYGRDGFTTKKRDLIPAIEPSLNHSTIGRLAKDIDDYDFIIHPGDFGYADAWHARAEKDDNGDGAYQSVLERFYDQLAPISGRKPYMVSPGNHEAACDTRTFEKGLCPLGQKNFTDFLNRFGATMPRAFETSSKHSTAAEHASKAKMLANPPFWYSFEYGMAHIVMFDTETDFPEAPDQGERAGGYGPFGTSNQQLDFLEADLASVDRTVTPWVVVAGHRPWYTTGKAAVCRPCQRAFEPIFNKHGVDLVVLGHVHNSQRFVPLNDGVADPAGMNNPKAPMYIVAGGAGNIEGLYPLGHNVSHNVFGYAEDFSFAKVIFKDRNHLQVDFIRSKTGHVLDSSVLFKTHTEQFSLSNADSASGGGSVLPFVGTLLLALVVSLLYTT